MSDNQTSKSTVRKGPRPIRFGLRTLLFFFLAIAMTLGVLVSRADNQRRSVRQIRSLGGRVLYDYQFNNQLFDNSDSSVPTWLLNTLGEDFFHYAVQVDLVHDATLENAFQRVDYESVDWADTLGGFKSITKLSVMGGQVNDDILSRIGELPNLENFLLRGSSVEHPMHRLTHPNVTDRGFLGLLGAQKLKRIQITECRLTDASLRALLRHPQLKHLYLHGNFTQAAIAAVDERFPAARVITKESGE